jgi:hypothetical protein
MNNFDDEDPQLTNFLRQHRPIVLPESSELENSLMSEIDLLADNNSRKVSRTWWRYIASGIAIFATGVVGIAIHQVMNPPEPSMAELHQLDLYLEAHANSLVITPEFGNEDRHSLADLDIDVFSDNDDDSVDS